MANKSFVVQYLIKARDGYSRNAEKAARATEKFRKNIDRAKHSLRAFENRSKTAFNKISRRARNSGLAMTAGITAPLAFMAKKFKDASRDAEETQSRLRDTFTKTGAVAAVKVAALATKMKHAQTTIKAMAAHSADIMMGMGLTEKRALEMSIKLNERAIDVAAFKNVTTQRASNAMITALTGERETLKNLGYAVTEAQVKLKIIEMVKRGVRFTTLQHAKAEGTFALMMELSNRAAGNFLRTQKDLAQQEKVTAESFIKFKEVLGQDLLPVFKFLTIKARELMTAYMGLDQSTRTIIKYSAVAAAVLGPLLLIIGSIGLAVPFITTGFALMGTAFAALGAFSIPLLGLATIAYILYANWEKFSILFKEVGKIIGKGIFSMVKDFEEIGKIIGKEIYEIVKNIEWVIEKIGSIKSFDFSGKMEDAGRTLLGMPERRPEAPAGIGGKSGSMIDLRVGLDDGLKQTSKPEVKTQGERRPDVGVSLPAY